MNNKYYYLRLKNILGLSIQITKADFILRNEGSYVGILWYLINPILTFGLLFFIFSDRLGNDINHYPIYLLLGIIIFNFFQSTTIESTKLIISENNTLIKSINFPKEALIVSIVMKNLISHFFEILLFSFLLIYFHINVFLIIFYFPILLLFVIFIFGTSMILSSLTVFFVDLDNIWNFLIRLIWLGTPIFYSIAGQTKLFYFNIFNPLYYYITATRDIIIYKVRPENWILLGMVGFSLSAILIGFLIFNKLKNKIPELI